jgi:hypothetical protein
MVLGCWVERGTVCDGEETGIHDIYAVHVGVGKKHWA